MILYKYMSLGGAEKVIENQSIGFSNLEDFNDPFEGQALLFNSKGGVPSGTKARAFQSILSRKHGVLSLTRNPINSLMWAHYADEHRGVVLGIDVNVAGLDCPETSLIPASFGDIIYTSTHPRRSQVDDDFEALTRIGKDHSFSFENYSFYRDAFLYKDMSWSYEEEVRVVKNVEVDDLGSNRPHKYQNQSGSWLKTCIHGQRPLFCYSLPEASIFEVYLGCRARAKPEYDDFLKLTFESSPAAEVFDTYTDSGSWNLSYKLIPGI